MDTASSAASSSPILRLNSGMRACSSASFSRPVLSCSIFSSFGVNLNCSVKRKSFSRPSSLRKVVSRSLPGRFSRRFRLFCSIKQELRKVSASTRPSSVMIRSLAVPRRVIGSSSGIPSLRTCSVICCPLPRSITRLIINSLAPMESVRVTLARDEP